MNALLQRLDECRAKLDDLTQENTRLRSSTKDTSALKKENRKMAARINLLEKELKVHSGRSQEIKSKVKNVIERIESIESEIAQL